MDGPDGISIVTSFHISLDVPGGPNIITSVLRGRWEGGSGWGRHVNSRTFHFNVRQNSLQIKKKKKSGRQRQKGSQSDMLRWEKDLVCPWTS